MLGVDAFFFFGPEVAVAIAFALFAVAEQPAPEILRKAPDDPPGCFLDFNCEV